MKIDEKKFRVLLAERGITNAKLAGKMGVSASCVTQYRYGTVRPATAAKIAGALGVRVQDIIKEAV